MAMGALGRERTARDEGMVTAEYATCGVAGTGFAVLLYNILMSPTVYEIVLDTISFLMRFRG